MSSTFTTEFGHEYERERGRWLRRRFLWYSGVVIGFYSLVLLVGMVGVGVLLTLDAEQIENQFQFGMATIRFDEPIDGGGVIPKESVLRAQVAVGLAGMGAMCLSILVYAAGFWRVRRGGMDRVALLRLVTQLIVLSGLAGIAGSILSIEMLRWVAPDLYAVVGERGVRGAIGMEALVGVMLVHLFACLFLPWTARESLRPFVPLGIVAVGVTGFYSRDNLMLVPLAIFVMLLIALPGLAVCWLRASRFRSKFHFKMVTRRYGEMKSELDAARQIHDAMFPLPIDDGPVLMRYSYEPMREIGGDYLFAHKVATAGGEGRGLLVVLIDVTGHGISAALTVNRLQGEIERQVSMDRQVRPGKVLSELNDYLHHTLAKHSVYATALVMRIDPDAETVVWASAGHPPGFLCSVDGTMHHLDSTTIVLGATRGEHFESIEEQLPFCKGDTLLAYTDGAIEAKNAEGRMLRIEGVEGFLSAHCKADGVREDLARALLEYVHGFRSGAAEDDSLIVEVRRPV